MDLKLQTMSTKLASANTKPQTKNIPSNWSGVDLEQFGWEQFQRGEEHQKQKTKDEFNAIIEKNIGRATTLSENIFHIAQKDYEVNISKALLKIESLYHFETIFLVDKEDFLSSKIKSVYEKSHSIKSDFNCDEFYISFKFMPFSENINRDCLHVDGFTLEYGQGKQKSASR